MSHQFHILSKPLFFLLILLVIGACSSSKITFKPPASTNKNSYSITVSTENEALPKTTQVFFMSQEYVREADTSFTVTSTIRDQNMAFLSRETQKYDRNGSMVDTIEQGQKPVAFQSVSNVGSFWQQEWWIGKAIENRVQMKQNGNQIETVSKLTLVNYSDERTQFRIDSNTSTKTDTTASSNKGTYDVKTENISSGELVVDSKNASIISGEFFTHTHGTAILSHDPQHKVRNLKAYSELRIKRLDS